VSPARRGVEPLPLAPKLARCEIGAWDMCDVGSFQGAADQELPAAEVVLPMLVLALQFTPAAAQTPSHTGTALADSGASIKEV